MTGWATAQHSIRVQIGGPDAAGNAAVLNKHLAATGHKGAAARSGSTKT